MPGPDRTWELISRHFEDGVATFFPMAPEGETPTPELVAEIGARLGIAFPADYVDHVCGQFPGVAVEINEDLWPRPQLHEVGPLWLHLFSLFTYTPIAASEDWMRIDVGAQALREKTGLVAAPILKVPSAPDLVCVDAQGAMCRWWRGSRELDPIGKSFWEVFEEELQGLAYRAKQRRAVLTGECTLEEAMSD